MFVAAMAFSFLCAQFQGRIEGTVLDENGNPLEKVEVSIISQKSSSIHFELTTDKEGKFFQVGLHPGYYVINLKKGGFAPVSSEIRITIAGEGKFRITMKSAESIDETTDAHFCGKSRTRIRGHVLDSPESGTCARISYTKTLETTPKHWAKGKASRRAVRAH